MFYGIRLYRSTYKAGAEGYFDKRKIEELVRYYGLALSVPIYIEGNSERINRIPRDFQSFNRSQLLGLGNWLFDEEFLDAIPICTKHLNGVAYVLSYETSIARKNEHRIYLKQMLLTEKGDTLIPSWAFFLKCFLNTGGLRPTASREDFYEDEELEEARKEFADAIKQYLANLSENEPERLQHIVGTHLQAIKAMAVWDDMMFKLFIDYLPFETSERKLTGAALKQIQEQFLIHGHLRI